MAIAIGLSGFLILMLSGMLSQTLLVSTASQNELIAAQAAEELLENARVMTYSQITTLSNSPYNYITIGQPITFVVNQTQTGETMPQLRLIPVQLNLASNTPAYGEVNPSSTTLVNAGAKWGPGFGNFFSGTATETITGPFTSGGVSWYQIAVQISYTGTYADSTGARNTKQLNRVAYVVNQGLNWQ
jgi:hypothetical protein